MPKKNKRAFNKKNSVTYRLVPAERTDDENAPKHIFVPVAKGGKKLPSSLPESLNLQNEPVIVAAASTSQAENSELDPEIQAALEGDFDFEDPENALEDDFITKAICDDKGISANNVPKQGKLGAGDDDNKQNETSDRQLPAEQDKDNQPISSNPEIVNDDPMEYPYQYPAPNSLDMHLFPHYRVHQDLSPEENMKVMREKYGMAAMYMFPTGEPNDYFASRTISPSAQARRAEVLECRRREEAARSALRASLNAMEDIPDDVNVNSSNWPSTSDASSSNDDLEPHMHVNTNRPPYARTTANDLRILRFCRSNPHLDHNENMKILREKFGQLLHEFDTVQENELKQQQAEKCDVVEAVPEPNPTEKKNDLFDSDFSDEEDFFLNGDSDGDDDETDSDAKSDTAFSKEMSTLDEKFEKVLESYDDDQIGALDLEEMDNYQMGGNFVTEMLLELKAKKAKDEENENIVFGNYDDEMKKKILDYAKVEKPEEFIEITTEKPPEFDCESILSTYSSLYNHPTIIKDDSIISTKLNKRKLTKRNLKDLEEKEVEKPDTSDEEMSETRSLASSARPKDETPEERRMRKKIVKEAQRENRVIKKENKLAFREEKRRQGLQQISHQKNTVLHLG